jgi:hypothetical protein
MPSIFQTAPTFATKSAGRLIRFHGVLAPNAKLQALVVPRRPEAEEHAADAANGQRMRGRAGSGRSAPDQLGAAAQARVRHRHAALANCGCGELKIIAAILGRPVIEKSLQ